MANQEQVKKPRERSANKAKESRAYVVTLIDFEGNPLKQTMVFTNNVKNKNKPQNGLPAGLILTELGYVDIVKKMGMEKIVLENYAASRKKQNAKVATLETICKGESFVLSHDSFKPGRFYLTFAPMSDEKIDDYSSVGTGNDLYWVVDDIKTMQENNLKQFVGVVS